MPSLSETGTGECYSFNISRLWHIVQYREHKCLQNNMDESASLMHCTFRGCILHVLSRNSNLNKALSMASKANWHYWKSDLVWAGNITVILNNVFFWVFSIIFVCHLMLHSSHPGDFLKLLNCMSFTCSPATLPLVDLRITSVRNTTENTCGISCIHWGQSASRWRSVLKCHKGVITATEHDIQSDFKQEYIS